jgi:hypothetical protein
MARIYNPNLQGVAQVQTSAVNPLSGLGDMLSGIAAQQKQHRFAIDTANFEMQQIDALTDFEENGQHDAATGKDLYAGTPTETSLPEMAMTKYNEAAAEIESQYGDAGKEFVANHKVQHYGRIVNSYANMRVLSNVDYAEKMSNSMAAAVEDGSMTFNNALDSSSAFVDSIPMPPQAREGIKQSASDMFTHSAFKRDLKFDPEVAVKRAKSKYYSTTASPRIQAAIENETQSYLMGRAMSERTAAENAAAVSWRHKPDTQITKLMEDFGMHEAAAEVKASQAKAARRDFYGSNNLQDSKILISKRLADANIANDPVAAQEAAGDLRALTERENLVKQNPSMALENEGVAVSRVPINDPAYVESRRKIRLDTENKFGVRPQFFGDGDAADISENVLKAPVNERASFVMALAGNMSEAEQQSATNELSAVNKNIGVLMSIAPRGSEVDAGVKRDRMDIGTAVLAGVDKDYLPKDADLKTYFSTWEQNVNWGDPAVKDAVRESAMSAYTYYARRDGKVGAGQAVDKDLMDSVMERVTGGKIVFGKGKSTNFMLTDGNWADPDKAQDSLESAVDMGSVPDIYDSTGAPLKSSELKKVRRISAFRG